MQSVVCYLQGRAEKSGLSLMDNWFAWRRQLIADASKQHSGCRQSSPPCAQVADHYQHQQASTYSSVSNLGSCSVKQPHGLLQGSVADAAKVIIEEGMDASTHDSRTWR